jgi:hypothetical protein
MSELTGLWIPLEYLRNDLLTGNERLIVSYVRFKQGAEGFDGKIREVANDLGIKENRVSEAITMLIKKGFLERIDRVLKVSEKWRISEKRIVSEKRKHSEKRILKKYPKNGDFISEKRILSETIPYSNISIINNDNNDAKNEEEKIEEIKKSSKVSTKKTSLPEIEFLHSEFKDFKVFEEYIRQAHPEINTSFYYHKISSWIDKNTGEIAKRKIWKSTVQQFLENDYKKGELITTKSKGHGKPTNANNLKQTNSFKQPANAEQLKDLISRYLVGR